MADEIRNGGSRRDSPSIRASMRSKGCSGRPSRPGRTSHLELSATTLVFRLCRSGDAYVASRSLPTE